MCHGTLYVQISICYFVCVVCNSPSRLQLRRLGCHSLIEERQRDNYLIKEKIGDREGEQRKEGSADVSTMRSIWIKATQHVT